jgi:hypothetical protein
MINDMLLFVNCVMEKQKLPISHVSPLSGTNHLVVNNGPQVQLARRNERNHKNEERKKKGGRVSPERTNQSIQRPNSEAFIPPPLHNWCFSLTKCET